ncbi:insulinase family protein [Crocinitomix catalasitica]|nr:insulinase family protein [Crocinitomix catalasitica]
MDRAKGPEYKQAESIELTFPKLILLENGVELFHFDDVKDESVKLDISWSAGSKYQSQNLTAAFANKMLLSGTKKLEAQEISEEIDFYGGFVQKNIDKDHAGITVYGLSENISSIFKVVSNAINDCQIPENELQKERDVALSQYRIDSDKVKNLCKRKFSELVFGEDSEYGRQISEEDFHLLDSGTLLDFINNFYLRNKPTLFLCGKVDETFTEELNDWALMFNSEAAQKEATLRDQVLGSVHVNHDGAIQSAIRIGRRLFDKQHPDYFSFQLLNTILGGYFGSRLMTNIREDKGYTYGIGSALAVLEDSSYFFVGTEVGTEARANTIEEIFNEIELLRTELIGDKELGKVKNYLFGEFMRQSDGPIPTMECFKNIYFNKLKESYYSDFFRTLHSTKAEDIKNLANKYLKKEDMIVVSVG